LTFVAIPWKTLNHGWGAVSTEAEGLGEEIAA
jgi:hypothetical protein